MQWFSVSERGKIWRVQVKKKIINFPLDIKRLHGHTYYHPIPQSISTTLLTQNDINERAPFYNVFSNRNKLYENISVGWCL